MDSLAWFPFSILSTTLFGISLAFYKIPAAKNQNRFVATFWSVFTSTVLALIFFYPLLSQVTGGMVWAGFLWGATFSIQVVLQMYALSHFETNVLFPITTTLSLTITVIFGIFLFGDVISGTQIIGILLVIFTVLSFLYKRGKLNHPVAAITAGAAIISLSAFGKILQKIVVDNFDFRPYQIIQYAFAALVSLIIFSVFNHKKGLRSELFSASTKTGIIIGTFSFFGGYAWLTALTKGPFSLVSSVHSLYVFITAVIAYFFFKEKLTKRKVVLIFVAIAAVLLLRLG